MNKISRSFSYTQGIHSVAPISRMTALHNGGTVYRHGAAAARRRRALIVVCDSCGQSHETGRNHLYDYPEEVDEALLCQVCLQPLVDPVDVSPCSHTFCHRCIMDHLTRCSSAGACLCPTDRQPIAHANIHQSNLLVRGILDKLKVVCPNTAYCDMTMNRCTLERHLKTVCPGTYVHCPRSHRGCTYMGPRCQLEEHLWGCIFGEDCNIRSKIYYST